MKRMDIFIQYAVASAVMAMEDAQLKITPANADRVGWLSELGWGG